MRPKPGEARERLLKALRALENPGAFCREHGHNTKGDIASESAYVAGAVKMMIEFALRDLGEPINPFRPFSAGPYVRPDRL